MRKDGVPPRMNTTESKTPTPRGIAFIYCCAALALIWYVLKGADDLIYLFWALGLIVHATGQSIIRTIRIEKP